MIALEDLAVKPKWIVKAKRALYALKQSVKDGMIVRIDIGKVKSANEVWDTFTILFMEQKTHDFHLLEKNI